MKRNSLAAIVAGFFLAGVAAAFLAVAPLTAAEPRVAPALWKIDGPQGDVYLFGSIHVLPKGLSWRPPALDQALNEAQRLVFEINLDQAKNPAVMLPLVSKHGLLPQDQSLRKMLAPENRKKFDEVATSLGLMPQNLERMRPWFAALTLSSLSVMKQLKKPGEATSPQDALESIAGVDQQLWDWAKTAGKERAALETAEDQLRIFADLPREREIEFLILTLREIGQPQTGIDDLIGHWLAGDIAKLDQSFNAGMDTFPALRNAILRDRHEKWIPQIEAMMADGRTHVIVVGTAHLVGRDSVIAMLRAKGVKIEGP
jgi:uncharacterized protein